ncbi:MAG TPA: N-acetylglucosamine kinase [Flavobacterium sp.]|jgi:N-acetylglucosamine kinase-like BadF-type ATPase|uniref:BadF/BadG/BcrA/BcrD ATPase family protein n=1 Tax=Flavobacterium sp. TaxID=239 RepID=UPI001B7293F5|nr:BadF/BadG/BcrA/BcrD ATPase family protein [Flavobacterium sp.]MBA4154813.1 N-acetylglucosamine kinase [Flavobacterium sp.]MBP6585012.1 N-acetylglucosamine kinase [Flavobacterium sp.]HQV35798.1 N-acetylglucosamine kinase [Flavobacterium sp.]HQX02991.1 N-acetylglucosamine kinase [Flavobacterium sp.]HRZ32527.1 N-acetylglucosamine kinase [Flavobacterium sp.]
MKLLVDGGSTKADWIAIDENGKVLFTTQTLGLNPEVLDKEEVIARLEDKFDISHNRTKAKNLYFYGAGCGTDRMKNYLAEVFQEYFPNATVAVYEDTYAAVYATTPKDEEAIVCILGTGSNCSYFDGKILHQKVQSLGYIAMDDGSGNRFGRHLIRGYYFNKMPKELAVEFEEEYNVEPDYIKANLYKEANPNAYLATFAKFIIKHKEKEFCKKIIYKELTKFVKNYIMQYENCKTVPVHFVGSIAFYLKDELTEILSKYDIKIGNVLRRPIDGLIAYHVLNK